MISVRPGLASWIDISEHVAPAVLGCLVWLSVPAVRAQDPVAAFVNVSVIPMDREQIITGQTVIVRQGRISALGPASAVPVPTGAVRVDGRGKFLIPGLADMHAHVPSFNAQIRRLTALEGDRLRQLTEPAYTVAEIDEAEHMLTLYAANGVTTVRIMHGAPEILTLRTRAASGELFSPRIFVATSMLRDGPALIPAFNGVSSPAEAVKIAVTAKRMGYDLLKLYGIAGLRLDSLAATARRIGIPMAGHVPDDENGIQEAIKIGYASIEHLSGFMEYLTGREQWAPSATVDLQKLHSLAAELRRAGIWICPTFMVNGTNIEYFTQDSIMQRSEFRYYASASKTQPAKPHARSGGNERLALQAMDAYRQIVHVLQEENVGLLLGTDATTQGVVPGFSLHRELQELVTAGLTPYQALLTGTRNVATYFGTQDSTGTIAVGKRADLVLLLGNPLQEIRHTATPAGVMIGGRWFDRTVLDDRLKAIEGTLH